MTNQDFPDQGVNLADVIAALQKVDEIKAGKAELAGKVQKIEASRSTVSPSVYEKVRGDYQAKLLELEKSYALIKKDLLPSFLSLQKEYTAASETVRGLGSELEELTLRFNLGEFSEETHRSKTEELERRKYDLQDRMSVVEDALNRIYDQLGDEPEFLTISSPLPSEKPAKPPPQETAKITVPAKAPPVAAEPELPTEPPPPPPAAVEEPVEEPEEAFGEEEEDLLDVAFGGSGIPDMEDDILDAQEGAEGAAEGSQEGVSLEFGDSSVPKEFFDDVIDVSDEPVAARQAPAPRDVAPPAAPPRREPSIIPTLIIKDKEDREQSYQLQIGPTMIGRAPENDIVLLEENISRRHAKLVREEDHILIQDLNSSNGTWVNGKKLSPHDPCELQDNDVIKIGKTLVLFKCAPDD